MGECWIHPSRGAEEETEGEEVEEKELLVLNDTDEVRDLTHEMILNCSVNFQQIQLNNNTVRGSHPLDSSTNNYTPNICR